MELRRILMGLYLLAFPAMMWGQTPVVPGTADEEHSGHRKETPVNFGFKGGFTSSLFLVSQFSVNGVPIDEVQNNYKIGYFGSLFMRINFDRHFLQPEISYNINRCNITFEKPLPEDAASGARPEEASITSSIHSIDIPVIYGYNFIKEGPYSLAVFGGPKVRYIWDRKSDIDFENFDQVNIRERLRPLNLSFTVGKGRQLALIGNNGCGKSTLLQIMAGKLQPSSGNVLRPDDLYYVPQHFGQYDEMSIAQALGIDRKQKALHEILNGNASIDHFNILDDDWNIEEKALAALNGWGLGNRSLSESMHTLSGGEKTRVFLAGLELQTPSAVLMDEPTNHLDNQGRNRLYEWVKKCRSTLIVVSHDRTLLNRLPETCELSRNALVCYGGNYEFYKQQKELQQNALQQQLDEKEKELRQIRKLAREVAERKEKQNIRSEKAVPKKGISRMAVHT